MRFLMKVVIPVEAGNEMVRDPDMSRKMQELLSDLEVEAAYFGAEPGQRSFHLIVNIESADQIPAVTEPFYLAFKADVDLIPIMTLEDIQKSAPAIAALAKKYGS